MRYCHIIIYIHFNNMPEERQKNRTIGIEIRSPSTYASEIT
jgi:hypothetical protein